VLAARDDRAAGTRARRSAGRIPRGDPAHARRELALRGSGGAHGPLGSGRPQAALARAGEARRGPHTRRSARGRVVASSLRFGPSSFVFCPALCPLCPLWLIPLRFLCFGSAVLARQNHEEEKAGSTTEDAEDTEGRQNTEQTEQQ